MKTVAVLDYGSGNIHSAVRMLEHVGADVTLTADADTVQSADGLFVPGVGNFHACMRGLEAAQGRELIAARLAAQRPVLGVCVGMQVMFDGSTEPAAERVAGLGYWPGDVARLQAPVVPHMGWSQVDVPDASVLFDGVAGERFYFVHSYARAQWTGGADARVTTARHGESFIAAVEDGPLAATQFHPEKSGEAGARVLTNWLASL